MEIDIVNMENEGVTNMEDEGIAVEDDSDTCTVFSSWFKRVPENDREYARLDQFLCGLRTTWPLLT
jgi:hypothetical protein